MEEVNNEAGQKQVRLFIVRLFAAGAAATEAELPMMMKKKKKQKKEKKKTAKEKAGTRKS